MVALTPRFVVLGAFVSLASLSLAPLSAAIAIQREESAIPLPVPLGESNSSDAAKDKNGTEEENSNKARFVTWPPMGSFLRLAQLKRSKKRSHDALLEIDLLPVFDKRADQAHFHSRRGPIVIPTKQGASYYVSPHKHSKHGKHFKQGERPGHARRDHSGVEGSPDSGSPTGKKIASLYMVPSDQGPNVLSASETNATPMYLVSAPSTSRAQSGPADAEADLPVLLQVPMYDPSSEPGSLVDYCTTYSTAETKAEPLTLQRCDFVHPNKRSEAQTSQLFVYNPGTGVIRPFWSKDALDGEDGQAGQAGVQGVLQRDDAAPRNVTLVFRPSAPQVANVMNTMSNATETDTTPTTSTMTTTVTVTSSATPTLSAADVEVTSSSISSDAAVPATSKASTPSAGALDVQVVGPPSSSTTEIASSTEAAVTPTTTINAQEIAESIAASSSATTATASTITLAAAAANDASSSVASSTSTTPSAAMVKDDSTPVSTTESSAAPSMTPFSTEPYKWVFRRG